jgi:hypothetical protein
VLSGSFKGPCGNAIGAIDGLPQPAGCFALVAAAAAPEEPFAMSSAVAGGENISQSATDANPTQKALCKKDSFLAILVLP